MKMRVGEITMDQQQGVEFHNAPPATRQEGRSPQRRSEDEPSESIDLFGIPIPRRSPRNYKHLMILAAAMAGLGVLGTAAVTMGIGFSLFSLVGLKMTVGAAIFGVACQLARRKIRQQRQQQRQQLRRQRGDRLLQHFEDNPAPKRLEQLAEELGWSNEAVADGLHCLIDRQQVVEDLDTSSGEWIYDLAVTTPSDDPRQLPLEERFDTLEQFPVNESSQNPQ